MPETARLNGFCNGFELDFMERVTTPKRAMKLVIHLHLADLSLSNTVSSIENLGVDRARSTLHNWVQKADLKPRNGRDLDKIALDETVIKVNGEQYWLYSAVDPETNVIPHVSLYPTRTIVVTKMFLGELRKNIRSRTPNFTSMERRGSKLDYSSSGCIFGTKPTTREIQSNVFFRR